MRLLIASVLLIAFSAVSGSLRGQTTDVKPVEIRGHYIGESTVRFLHLEPEARESIEVCRQHPTQSVCDQLLAAIERGQRAEISTSVPLDMYHPDEAKDDAINFVLDGKKLVKMAMLVNDVSDARKILGHPSSESAIPSQDSSGAKWENRRTVWETPEAYVTLYQDNNPSLRDRRPVLTIETRAEHAREEAESTKRATVPQ